MLSAFPGFLNFFTSLPLSAYPSLLQQDKAPTSWKSSENSAHPAPFFPFAFSFLLSLPKQTGKPPGKRSLHHCPFPTRVPLLEKQIQMLGFPGGSDGKESAWNAGDPGLIPGSGRSPGKRIGYPLLYSCLENSMDREACWGTVHRVAKSQTRLSN